MIARAAGDVLPTLAVGPSCPTAQTREVIVLEFSLVVQAESMPHNSCSTAKFTHEILYEMS